LFIIEWFLWLGPFACSLRAILTEADPASNSSAAPNVRRQRNGYFRSDPEKGSETFVGETRQTDQWHW
jgi:hypothetical protein